MYVVFGCIWNNFVLIHRGHKVLCNLYQNGTCAVTLSGMTLLFEDLAQIILAWIVALKTKDLVAPVHFVKAGYGILEPFIQITTHSCPYCKLRKTTTMKTRLKCGARYFKLLVVSFSSFFLSYYWST